MRIENTTKYDTIYLRRLFLACEKHCFNIYLRHGNSQRRRVTIMSHNTGWIGGWAWFNSYSVTIKLPANYTGKKRIPKWASKEYRNKCAKIQPLPARRVAQVYLHELAHNFGLIHKQMIPATKIDVSWWPDESVPLKILKEKPKVNLIEMRAAKAQKKLDEWQTKLKRARTGVKKYQTKVRYYEKKTAALPSK